LGKGKVTFLSRFRPEANTVAVVIPITLIFRLLTNAPDETRTDGNRNLSVIAFHERAGRSQVDSFVFSWDTIFLFRRVATDAMLPSALFVSALRSVHVGRSRFSPCCHLIGDLSFHGTAERGPGY